MKEHLKTLANSIDELATDLGTGTLEIVELLNERGFLSDHESSIINDHFEETAEADASEFTRRPAPLIPNPQNEICEWQNATFPHATELSMFKHLRKEINELGEDLKDESEMADCYLLLTGIADKQGVNLIEAGLRKLEINKKRKWSDPDSEGVYSHIP